MREIYVFGTDRAGRHDDGSAIHAAEAFGAQLGVSDGATGNAYAITTRGPNSEQVPFREIDAALCRLLDYAVNMPDARFLLEPVGTGVAGHLKSDVWDVLKREGLPRNVMLTSTWVTDW
ncbi:hypothetical protein [uncultured Jannaschia sp.]|uniref:A1S_2505 family phage non-structural protein n=1 Tax=uncultured Jannaschia sp. TaxID=293347 RepID=UPI0026330EA7|nr:hypothetical protein [uncultured Jannaschia sp.]